MRSLPKSLRAGISAVAFVVITLAAEKYLMNLFPEKLNLLTGCVIGAAILIFVGVFFWDKIRGTIFKPKRDWDAWQVYKYLGKWTVLRHLYPREINSELRQAALDGAITVWAQKGITAPYNIVPPEKFADYVFDLKIAVGETHHDAPLALDFIRKIVQAGQESNFLHPEIYYDPYFCRIEIKRQWSRQFFRVLYQKFRRLISET